MEERDAFTIWLTLLFHYLQKSDIKKHWNRYKEIKIFFSEAISQLRETCIHHIVTSESDSVASPCKLLVNCGVALKVYCSKPVFPL